MDSNILALGGGLQELGRNRARDGVDADFEAAAERFVQQPESAASERKAWTVSSLLQFLWFRPTTA